MNHLSISGDVPSEMTELSDGVTDDGAFDQQIIGACSCDAVSGLGSIAVAGVPGYLFTRSNLASPIFRRRVAQNIKAMTPKLRRRVMNRLRSALSTAARVSGAVNVYPTVGRGGWSGVSISGRRSSCPYANVAGALTP